MSEIDVVVVGAGAAGIAATRLLLAHGRRVMLIEARSRVGGRAWTTSLAPAVPFDAGASYLHAVDRDNPWVDLALAVGAELRPDRRRRLAPGERPERLAAFIAGIERLETWAAHSGGDLATAIPASAPARDDLLRFAGQWLCGVDAAYVDAGDFAALKAGEDWLAPAGYGSLVARLAVGLPLRLDCAVEAVTQHQCHVELETARGVVRAALAVLTVPLGVMAAETIRLDPVPPAPFRQALGAMPMGRLVKVGILFDGDPFAQGDGWYLMSAGAVEAGFLHHIRPGGLPMSMAFVGGGAVQALERPELIAEAAATSLVEAFGHAIRRRLLRTEVADWWHDPFARGSYAVPLPGGAWARHVLRQPLGARLLYAGEATAVDGWGGTVAGAWREGRRAAQLALDFLARTGE